MATPNTRLDAVLRIVEDTILVVGSAVPAWLASHSVNDVLTAVTAVPVTRSAIAAVLTKGRVSGLALAVKLVWQAMAAQTPAPEKLDPSLGEPVLAPDPAPATPVVPPVA